ncbi:MAG: hypothetical protein IKZ82_05365 [Clostridia bacterium]|nr:hypothetical protein [Clostridia bacterium]
MSETNTAVKKKKVQTDEDQSPIGVARRSIWYILRLLLVITLVVGLCYFALVEAMYMSNIYIIVTEGLERRADCILGNRSSTELAEYFTKEWIIRDEDIDSGKYDAFRVDSYDYRLTIEKMSVYPWSKEASIRVLEQVVNIQASPYNDSNKDPVPQWEGSRMEIRLEKIDNRWYITLIRVLQSNPEIEPGATPDYSQLETDIPHY